MASRTLKPSAKPVAHSDRGCQYASRAYREALEKLGWRSSMTEELHCYENAMAERLNGILKYEYFLNTHFKTKKEATRAISVYGVRPHRSRESNSSGWRAAIAIVDMKPPTTAVNTAPVFIVICLLSLNPSRNSSF